MLARKGITIAASLTAPSQGAMFWRFPQSSCSLALMPRISNPPKQLATTRSFITSSKVASQASEPARVPRPIPLDIGNNSSSFFQPSAAAAGSQAESASARASRRHRPSGGSVFDRFGGPIINVIVYSTAATLVLHLLYHHLALEEYKISSNKKAAELETEIAGLKAQRASNSVHHPLGGRGEFV